MRASPRLVNPAFSSGVARKLPAKAMVTPTRRVMTAKARSLGGEEILVFRC
jgi:hypothetical protein